MKLRKIFGAAMFLSAAISMTAYAGSWKVGVGENQSRWWYDNENGSYANSGWQWIDGNNDGVAECYYFDSEGWLLVNTSTPDGHFVNENGARVNNGVIETQASALQTGGETADYTNYYGWYKTLEEEDGYSDFTQIKVSAYDENSITISEFYNNTRTYTKGADNKYYPADSDGYFKYVYLDGNTLVCCSEGSGQDWVQHFIKNNE